MLDACLWFPILARTGWVLRDFVFLSIGSTVHVNEAKSLVAHFSAGSCKSDSIPCSAFKAAI